MLFAYSDNKLKSIYKQSQLLAINNELISQLFLSIIESKLFIFEFNKNKKKHK